MHLSQSIRPTRRGASTVLMVSAFAAFLLLAQDCPAPALPAAPSPAGKQDSAWREHPKPIISMGHTIDKMLWNDPSVLYEDGKYRMWLSGGDPSDLSRIVVKIYCAESDNGVDWNTRPTPCLSPSAGGRAFDSLRTETPTVVKANDVYHLYYTGFDEKTAKGGFSAIGHATSPDGLAWTKDPANPVLSGQTANKLKWGYGGAGEPGIVYNPKDKTFYLYYVGMRYSRKEPSIGHIGILLAKSRDGSNFEHYTDGGGERKLLLTRDIPGATPGAWFGYSTPSAFIDENGRFHLFCAFIVAPEGPATARHVVLAHAESGDGENFRIVEEEIFKAGRGDYMDQQVRSPTALRVNGQWRMWFAAEHRKPFFGAGIGYAVRD